MMTVKSPALKARGDISIFLPKGYESMDHLPLAILLHGVYGSHWSWSLEGNAHRTTAGMISSGDIAPMALIMPSDGLQGDGSGYLPQGTIDYERWIVADVIGAVTQTWHCFSEASPRYISGLSMGGYGALRLGLKYAQLFKGISAHSSITELEQMALFVEEDLQCYDQEGTNNESIAHWAVEHQSILPPIRMDCGTQDPLIAHNRSLHQLFKRLHVAHRYFEYAGGHEWDYWKTHLKDTLLFFNEIQSDS